MLPRKLLDKGAPARILGLMSGTSLDGIDAALVEFAAEEGRLRWRLLGWRCTPWEPTLREALLRSCSPQAPLQNVVGLNFLVAESFADAARALVDELDISFAEVDAIASHGQTVWHQAEPFSIANRPVVGSLQIGEPAVLAARTGCIVVADFRVADMAVGGQGAPLVPLADLLLLGDDWETRAVLNIGGIANVTYLPRGGWVKRGGVLAFDTGPGNMLLDGIVRHVGPESLSYDSEGHLAAKGRVHPQLLSECLSHPYLDKPPPKSTGREMFGEAYVKQLCNRARQLGLGVEDMLATAVAFTVESIALAFHRWLEPRAPLDRVIVGGGGVHNKTLMRALAERLAPCLVVTHEDFGIPNDAKEAIAFALLGYHTLQGLPGNLPSATGAQREVVLGKIVFPPAEQVVAPTLT